MALSTLVLVGEAHKWLPDIIAKAKSLTVGPGSHEKTEVLVRQ